MNEPTMTGGCACGKVRFEATVKAGRSLSLPLPHVPASDWLRLDRLHQRQLTDVRWDGEPDWFDSSPIATRPFCAQCGTSLGFMFRHDADKMDLSVAAFDDPSPFTPKHHFGVESMHRAWINTEGLPEYRTDEHQKLVDKWLAATGKMPG